jgi:hypothetical protein
MLGVICHLLPFTFNPLILGQPFITETNLIFVSETFSLLETFLRNRCIPHYLTTHFVTVLYNSYKNDGESLAYSFQCSHILLEKDSICTLQESCHTQESGGCCHQTFPPP